MIEGLILMAELCLFLVLLFKVWRVHHRDEPENTGLYAYRVERTEPPAPAGIAGCEQGKPHA